MEKLSSQFFDNVVKKSEEISKDALMDKTDEKISVGSHTIFYENNKFNNCFTDFTLIGSGGFGDVFKAMHKLEGKYYAVKKIEMNFENDRDLRT